MREKLTGFYLSNTTPFSFECCYSDKYPSIIYTEISKPRCLSIYINTVEQRKEEEEITDANPHLCLNVECDEAICDEVVDGLEPFLPNKVLSVMIETEVSGLVPKPTEEKGQSQRKTSSCLGF